MTKNEATHLVAFLDELLDRFGNDGCNDYRLDNTAENRAMLEAMDDEVELFKGRFVTYNTTVLQYLRDKFAKENGLT